MKPVLVAPIVLLAAIAFCDSAHAQDKPKQLEPEAETVEIDETEGTERTERAEGKADTDEEGDTASVATRPKFTGPQQESDTALTLQRSGPWNHAIDTVLPNPGQALRSAMEQDVAGLWEWAAFDYLKVQTQYPYAPEAPKALLRAAVTMMRLKRYERAREILNAAAVIPARSKTRNWTACT